MSSVPDESSRRTFFVLSLLTVSDGPKKVCADEISVSSSGSSGSETEDLSSLNAACSISVQVNRLFVCCLHSCPRMSSHGAFVLKGVRVRHNVLLFTLHRDLFILLFFLEVKEAFGGG